MSTYSKIILGVCFVLLSATNLRAQNNVKDKNDPKYLRGAVPEIEGKVVFSETIQSDYSQSKIQQLLEQCAKNKEDEKDKNYNGRILYSDTAKHEVVMQIEDRLVFSSNAFSLDYAVISYYLIFQIENETCKTTIKNIRYKYLSEKELMTAENTISDEVALNKQKNKLNRVNDKFRIATIDMVESVFDEVDECLNKEKYDAAKYATKSRRSSNVSTTPVAEISDAKEVSPVETPVAVIELANIPSNDNVQVQESAVVVTEDNTLLSAESDIVALSREKDFAQSNFFLVGEDIVYVRQLAAISVTKVDDKPIITCYTDNGGVVLPQVMPTSKFKILYYKPNTGSYSKLAELSAKYARGEAYTENDITLIQLLLENSTNVLQCNGLKIKTKPTSNVSNNPTIQGQPSVGNLIQSDKCTILKANLND